MKTTAYHFNEIKYKKEIKSLEDKLPSIQKAIDAYHNIKEAPMLTAAELYEMFNDTMLFLGKKVVAIYGAKLNGLEIREDKLFEVFKKPEGVDEFLSAMQIAKSVFSTTERIAYVIITIDCFVLEDKIVHFKNEFLEEVKKNK